MTDLPPGWAWTTLAELVGADGIFTDGDWVETKDQDPSGGVRLTQLADVGEGWFRDRSNRFLSERRAAELKCTFLRSDDILIARMPEPLGRACLFPGAVNACVTVVDVAVLRLGGQSVNPRWLMWAINSPQVRDQITSLQSGTTRSRISRKNLAGVKILVPPFCEQGRIVAALEDNLFRVGVGDDHLKLALRKLTKARISEYWSETHTRIADNRAIRLDELAEVRLGRQRSPKNHQGESMRPYLRAANVSWSGLLLDDVKMMNFSESESSTYSLKYGDILMSEASGSPGEVGKPAIWSGEVDECCFQNTLIRVRCHSANPIFIMHYLRAEALRGSFISSSRGVGINHLGVARISAWPVTLPSFEEQERISEKLIFLDSVRRRLVDDLNVEMTKSSVLRHSLLDAAFSGRLVEQNPSDEPASVLLERIAAERDAAPKPKRTRKTKTTQESAQ